MKYYEIAYTWGARGVVFYWEWVSSGGIHCLISMIKENLMRILVHPKENVFLWEARWLFNSIWKINIRVRCHSMMSPMIQRHLHSVLAASPALGTRGGGKEDQGRSLTYWFASAPSLSFASSKQPPHNTTCLWGRWILWYMLLKGIQYRPQVLAMSLAPSHLRGADKLN